MPPTPVTNAGGKRCQPFVRLSVCTPSSQANNGLLAFRDVPPGIQKVLHLPKRGNEMKIKVRKRARERNEVKRAVKKYGSEGGEIKLVGREETGYSSLSRSLPSFFIYLSFRVSFFFLIRTCSANFARGREKKKVETRIK